jgi:uncharacterized protein YhfF
MEARRPGVNIYPGAMDYQDLPRCEFAFPGPLRDELVAAVLSGQKTTTAGLLLEYELEGLAVPSAGQREVVIDSDAVPVAIIELTEVRVLRVGDVDRAHAIDEGEGYDTVAGWRAAHERFWHSAEVRAGIGQPEFTVTDDTLIVARRFRVVERIPA